MLNLGRRPGFLIFSWQRRRLRLSRALAGSKLGQLDGAVSEAQQGADRLILKVHVQPRLGRLHALGRKLTQHRVHRVKQQYSLQTVCDKAGRSSSGFLGSSKNVRKFMDLLPLQFEKSGVQLVDSDGNCKLKAGKVPYAELASRTSSYFEIVLKDSKGWNYSKAVLNKFSDLLPTEGCQSESVTFPHCSMTFSDPFGTWLLGQTAQVTLMCAGRRC